MIMLMPLGTQPYRGAGIRTLLVIEDYDKLRAALGQHFERRGYRVYSVSRGKDAEALAVSVLPQAVLLDYDLGSEDAVMLAKHLRVILPGSAIVITGGPDNILVRSKIEAVGGIQYLPHTHELASLDALIEAMTANTKVK
jgi:DNA-binding response OmpR family regulator